MGVAAGWLLGDKQNVIAIRSLWDGPFLIVNSPGIERGSFGTTAVMPLCTGNAYARRAENAATSKALLLALLVIWVA